MDKNFKERKGFKNWYKDINNHNLMLSDDLDSLLSCKFLESNFNIEVDLFNDFSNMYFDENKDLTTFTRDKVIGVDLDLVNNKCFANHVAFTQNENCISLNNGVDYWTYKEKFAGSTLLTIMSLYNHNLSDYTTEQLEILLCVDTAFKQYNFNSDLFKHYYSDVLQYTEFVEIAERRSQSYFYDLINKYKMYEKIYINEEGYLETEIKLEELSKVFNADLSLPDKKFQWFHDFHCVGLPLQDFNKLEGKENIFSSAMTNRNFVVASFQNK